ncbi:hypothetical protein [Nocardiopsis lucentensis]|uniref:hypothetical protein n=1 Tax=Nocardiopsis lucentensis TaxID=53441 RepID=UPI0003462252|nr:hypothetical protein [Nocardiopsis lucentensis]
MAKYKVELTAANAAGMATTMEEEVEASFFNTVGEFVDFFHGPGSRDHVVLRVRADSVLRIERIEK